MVVGRGEVVEEEERVGDEGEQEEEEEEEKHVWWGDEEGDNEVECKEWVDVEEDERECKEGGEVDIKVLECKEHVEGEDKGRGEGSWGQGCSLVSGWSCSSQLPENPENYQGDLEEYPKYLKVDE